MIAYIIAFGAVAALVTALIHDMSGTTRGIVCWTSASVAFTMSLVVFFVGTDGLSPNVKAIVSGLCALGAVTAIILLIELFAPSKRFRERNNTDYDKRIAERSLDVVFGIVTVALAAGAVWGELSQLLYLVGVCLVPATAISLRQLSYYLYRARYDASSERSEKERRADIMRRLKSGRKEL